MISPLIFLASDHRGYALKAQFVAWLKENAYVPRDLGPSNAERCDAFDYAQALAAEMKANPDARGVLICGTGQAMAMTANRHTHLRAALCAHATVARMAREHNDANVLVLGADIVGQGLAQDCLETFLKTAFLGGRYAERRDKLNALPLCVRRVE